MPATQRKYLAFSENHVETYKKLGELLGKVGNRDQFLLAMSFGFRNGTKVEDFKRSNNGIRIEYLKEEDKAIMAAMQLADDGKSEELDEEDRRYAIAEQYAEGGILLLSKIMEEPGEFARWLSSQVKQELDALEIQE